MINYIDLYSSENQAYAMKAGVSRNQPSYGAAGLPRVLTGRQLRSDSTSPGRALFIPRRAGAQQECSSFPMPCSRSALWALLS